MYHWDLAQMMAQVIFNFFIDIKPVPASRPRVGKHGAYYSKNYADFRKEMKEWLIKNKKKEWVRQSCTFKVIIEFICKKPQHPTETYPHPDVDNFLKGPLDSFTFCECFWFDDKQVTILEGSKRYAEKDESAGMKCTIIQL